MPRLYFYEKNGQQFGPVPLNELVKAGIEEHTYIWYEGLDEWIEVKNDAEVLNALRNARPFIPPTFGAQSDDRRFISGDHSQPMPPNYLVLSILSLLCGCIPLGLVSIFFSVKVKEAYNNQDYNKANLYSQRAKTFGIAAIVIGLIFSILYIFYFGEELMNM